MQTETTDTQPLLTDGDLTVTDDELIYCDRRIALKGVTAIRYGWLPIRLDMFRIGGRYVLEVKTDDQKIKMDFRYYFGLFSKRQSEKFNALLDIIWDATIVRLLGELVADIDGGQTVVIGKCAVSAEGILLKNFFITWMDLSYQRNYNKLTINSKSRDDIWTNLYYTETDNVHVLALFLKRKFADSPTLPA